MRRIAFIGGGPGGLMAARELERQTGGDCCVTLFEASDGSAASCTRVGSAPRTSPTNQASPSATTPKRSAQTRSKRSSRELGLTPIPTHSTSVALDGTLLRGDEDLARHIGQPTLDAVRTFRRLAASQLSRAAWVDGLRPQHNSHPWGWVTWQQVLEHGVTDAAAQRYVRVVSHSDLATEPHLGHWTPALSASGCAPT
jgi:hypothetical protein